MQHGAQASPVRRALFLLRERKGEMSAAGRFRAQALIESRVGEAPAFRATARKPPGGWLGSGAEEGRGKLR
jgi:hypothetical protein